MGKKSKFTRDEKIAAVKLVTEGGRTGPSVANEYGIHENTLWKWKRQFETNPEQAFNSEAIGPLDETTRLKRRIAELELENEFLKKAAAYFAKDSR